MEEASFLQNTDNEGRHQHKYYVDITINEYNNKANYEMRHTIFIGYLIRLANIAVNLVLSTSGPINDDKYRRKRFN